jgi:hypothetical protein
MNAETSPAGGYPKFDREFFGSTEDFTVIGAGSLGGKAKGLAFIKETLGAHFSAGAFPDITVSIPRLTVMAVDLFDAFIKQNDLYEIAYSDASDQRIAHAFQKADLPAQVVGDLTALISTVHSPLAIRSSSLLEDAMFRPFAGVYATKMIPNNQLDTETRFRKLVEAIKFVYASTFFKDAKSYIRSTKMTTQDEKMAVIIQEVVGVRHGERFYPDISGVARSYNFYPSGHAVPRDGVVSLALGLGKTIVDGGTSWSYSPAYPRSNPPYGTVRDLLKQTQTDFWAVGMGKPPAYDPINEAEYLVKADLDAAEQDGTLLHVASTYDSESDRLILGIGDTGPRVVTFSPILVAERFPINDLVRSLMSTCEKAVGAEVEVEFAATIDPANPKHVRFGFLQVRPLVVLDDQVTVDAEDLTQERVLAASEAALGNGTNDEILDVVYLRPESFDTTHSRTIAAQVEQINRGLFDAGRPYLLIGFGRWGSSDPWLGVPVTWGQIAGAQAIIEASLPEINADASQGSHFFHNLTSFRVFYFSVRHTGKYRIDWDWLERQELVSETPFVRHVRLSHPLEVRVDGRSGRGVIVHRD